MEAFPVEKDPRFIKLLDLYRSKVEIYKKVETARFGAMVSVLTAPFFCIAASMQLSVKAHENLYGKKGQGLTNIQQLQIKTEELKQIAGNDKAVVKSEERTDVKVYKSDKAEKLRKMTGQVGINEPYRAPIYRTYRECITGLYRQGWLGFYKGNLFRQSYFFLSGVSQIEAAFWIKRKTGHYSYLNHLAGAIIADIFFHPLHLVESRYILQNRITPSYLSLNTLLRESKYDMYTGCLAHLPKNMMLALAGFQIFNSGSFYSLLIKEIAISALAYPIITACRRIECQVERQGMIPRRYKNVRHCFGLTYREEGFRGLYRGFAAYAIAITIYTTLVPYMTFMATRKNPMLGFVEDVDNEEF